MKIILDGLGIEGAIFTTQELADIQAVHEALEHSNGVFDGIGMMRHEDMRKDKELWKHMLVHFAELHIKHEVCLCPMEVDDHEYEAMDRRIKPQNYWKK